MTPVDSYNSQCDYRELLKGARGHKNLEVTDQCLLLFGNGDGGGGPTPRMLEKVSCQYIHVVVYNPKLMVSARTVELLVEEDAHRTVLEDGFAHRLLRGRMQEDRWWTDVADLEGRAVL